MQTINNLIIKSGSIGSDTFKPAPRQWSDNSVNHPAHKKPIVKDGGRFSVMKLAIGGILFLALSIGVFQYQFNQLQEDDSLFLWNNLEWGYLFLMLLVIPLETIAGGIRIWVICRILQPGVTYWNCYKAELANIGTGMLTPSQTGGGLAQIYILCRGGATAGSATTISFISFTGTMMVLFCIGLYSLFFSGVGNISSIFRYAVMIFLIFTFIMFLSAFFPDLFRRIIIKGSTISKVLKSESVFVQKSYAQDNKNTKEFDELTGLPGKAIQLINTYHEEVCHYLKVGKANFICVFMLSFALLLSRSLVAFMCIRFLGGHDSSLSHIVETQLVLLFMIYFVPTPGGSGLSETLSLSIMSSIIPMGLAPYYNLLWRTTTLYLPAMAGLICLFYDVVVQGRGYISAIAPGHPKSMRASRGDGFNYLTERKKCES